jgi:hypothetical protein
MEVTKASNASMSGSQTRSEGDRSSASTATSDLRRTSGSAGATAPGDFASQGATGEGLFGTTGGSTPSSGRYGSDAPLTTSTAGSAPSCFCGHQMQLAARSSAARTR